LLVDSISILMEKIWGNNLLKTKLSLTQTFTKDLSKIRL
jgi:hypothetical protein